MNQNIEIIPIAIPLNDYNRHIANLVEILLAIDDKRLGKDRSEIA
jgi:hypothetical protein